MNRREYGLLLALLAATYGCQPEFPGRISEVVKPTVLAAQSVPAEAPPGAAVAYRLLMATPDGTRSGAGTDWAYCTTPKPVKEINDVTTACFTDPEAQVHFGVGPSAQGTVPSGACREFGPDLPATKPGEPQGRPADPDATGGFYQPVVLLADSDVDSGYYLAQTRIHCNSPAGTADQIQQLRDAYQPNENPAIASVVLPDQKNTPLSPEGSATVVHVTHSSEVVMRISWAKCSDDVKCGDGICGAGEDVTSCPEDCTDPHGCTGSEPYLYYDPGDAQVVKRHEALRVSWSSTAGSFKEDHTGSPEEDHETVESDNTWTAPDEPGKVYVWTVLRDDRGGVDWRSFELIVD